MAEISWWAWLGVGLFVTIFSISAGGQLKLFAWIGVIFLVTGIAKLTYLVMLHPKQEKSPSSPKRYERPQPVCRRCFARVHQNDRFCRYCGLRLRT